MIEIKNADKFEELAKDYKIRYMRSPEGETYELNQQRNNQNGIDMNQVNDCLYANVPVDLRYKSAHNSSRKSAKQEGREL